MSANAIWFEKGEDRFYFDGCPVRVETLGRLVANALVQGAGYIDFDAKPRLSFERHDRDDKRVLSVNYVQQMLAFVGTHGWFWDCLDSTVDHRFDNTTPTPGTRWAEAQELFVQARNGFRHASDLNDQARSKALSPVEKRRLRRTARSEARDAHLTRIYAWERLMPGISRAPFSAQEAAAQVLDGGKSKRRR